jgi:hypothetical protein
MVITPALLRSLDVQTRNNLGQLVLDYIVLHRMRATEVDHAYVVKNKAAGLSQDLNELQSGENATYC